MWRSWKRNPRSTDFSEDIRRPCLGPRTGPISWLEMAVCCEGSTRQSSCAEVIWVRLPRRDLSRSQGYDAVGVAELVDPLAFLSKVMTPVGVPVAVGA